MRSRMPQSPRPRSTSPRASKLRYARHPEPCSRCRRPEERPKNVLEAAPHGPRVAASRRTRTAAAAAAAATRLVAVADEVALVPPLVARLAARGAAHVARIRAAVERAAVPAELAPAVRADVVVAAAILGDALLALGARLGRAALELAPHQLAEARVRLRVLALPPLELRRLLRVGRQLRNVLGAAHAGVRGPDAPVRRVAREAEAAVAVGASKVAAVARLPDEDVVARRAGAAARLAAQHERLDLALVGNLAVPLPKVVAAAAPRDGVDVSDAERCGALRHRAAQALGLYLALAHLGRHVPLEALGAEGMAALLQRHAGEQRKLIEAHGALEDGAALGGLALGLLRLLRARQLLRQPRVTREGARHRRLLLGQLGRQRRVRHQHVDRRRALRSELRGEARVLAVRRSHRRHVALVRQLRRQLPVHLRRRGRSVRRCSVHGCRRRERRQRRQQWQRRQRRKRRRQQQRQRGGQQRCGRLGARRPADGPRVERPALAVAAELAAALASGLGG
mmetsp:Transcript_29357/g.80516  ORF Transcript_29357/g.80516 Transcript_29357/m.80516 type:complete len:511 (+) Transcript_29357:110-1642(+)